MSSILIQVVPVIYRQTLTLVCLFIYFLYIILFILVLKDFFRL